MKESKLNKLKLNYQLNTDLKEVGLEKCEIPTFIYPDEHSPDKRKTYLSKLANNNHNNIFSFYICIKSLL